MKSFLLVFLVVLFASSVYAEDIVTPDGYLGRWSLDIWTNITHKEVNYAPSFAYGNLNNWIGGFNIMRPLSAFSTVYIEMSYGKLDNMKYSTDTKLLRQSSLTLGVRFYIK